MSGVQSRGSPKRAFFSEGAAVPSALYPACGILSCNRFYHVLYRVFQAGQDQDQRMYGIQ